jgi:class 3 adenylate cyclase
MADESKNKSENKLSPAVKSKLKVAAAESKKKSENEKPVVVTPEVRALKYGMDPDFLRMASEIQGTTLGVQSAAQWAAQFAINLPDPPSYLYSMPIPSYDIPTIDMSFLSSKRNFEEELVELRKQVVDQARVLREEKSSGNEKDQKIAHLESSFSELLAKQQIGFLLNRVNEPAQRQLLTSNEFRRTFLETKECVAFVMSIDIRRSTELMLKARNPELFAGFITTLCTDLMKIITDNFGVFDKFTGDGVLAIFPDFYSGKDAAYYTVAAADKCHESFREHYKRYRRSFSSVLTGIGLGIGIDFGSVHMVQMAGGLTVVGAPVVYACRLSGAPSGVTLVNQPAYEVISDLFGATCFINETTIEIKHEGSMLAYEVRLNGREYKPQLPKWIK